MLRCLMVNPGFLMSLILIVSFFMELYAQKDRWMISLEAVV